MKRIIERKKIEKKTVLIEEEFRCQERLNLMDKNRRNRKQIQKSRGVNITRSRRRHVLAEKKAKRHLRKEIMSKSNQENASPTQNLKDQNVKTTSR